jgi:O-antigen ligase
MHRLVAQLRNWRWALALAAFVSAFLALFFELGSRDRIAVAAVSIGLAIMVMAYWEAAYSFLVMALIAGLNINFVGPDPVDFLLVPTVLLGLIYGHVHLRRVYFGAALWIAIAAFCTSFVVSIVAGAPNWSYAGHFIRNLGLFGFLILYLQSRRRMRIVFAGLLIGVFFSGVISIFALFGYIGNDALLFPIISGLRYQSLMGDPNMLGLNTLLVLLWLFDEALTPSLWPHWPKLKWTLLMVLILQLLATLSRSAWTGVLVALMVYAALRVSWRDLLNMRLRTIAKGAVGIAAVVALPVLVMSAVGAGNGVLVRLASFQRGSSQGLELRRLDMDYTRNALRLALHHPLGVGPGRTEQTNSNWNPENLMNAGAHNTYVEVMSDYGWLAFAALIAILAGCGLRIYDLARRGREELGVSFAGLLAALLGCAALAMFQDILIWPFPWILPSLVMAALAANRRPRPLQIAA